MIQVQEGQTIYDIAIKSGYAIDNLYSLIQQNPIIDSIDFPIENTPGIQVQFIVMPSVSADVAKQNPATVDTIKTMLAQDGQSIYDLCQNAGYSLDQLYQFIQYNSIDSVNKGAFQGKILSFDTTQIFDSLFYKHLINNSLVINTSGDDAVSYRVLSTETKLIIVTETGYPLLAN